MNYQKEYACLIGQVDRAVSILENCASGDPAVRTVRELLLSAILDAEERYVSTLPR